ncbi:adenylate/guanylate cyclase domain-containing protein [Roseivirga sp. E12]|uniref:adenylate/guanylate cyclase domain-containing protein n=1 Tax=Roseivirga sp. E12 TaxID=2819237 RepID=UPI001ABCB021|nr:adenylate/guanylate cyclase domain-containing protein [Roseivirga sp. E12]MBO3697714.1 adenylate/guanylate cyclase domain-containing protein [Roseivirga sp. E12]
MAKLEFSSDKKCIQTDPEETILDAALKHDIPHVHACGGNAFCSTCRVLVQEGLDKLPERNDKELALAKQLGLPEEIRLACQTKPQHDLKVRRLVMDKVDEDVILQHGEEGKPRSLGQVKKASVLFVDIADYTAFTEKTPAYDVVHVLNRYFYIAGSIIKKYNGRIIDYYGDGFLAIFGLDDDPKHAGNLISAGFALQDAVDKFDHDIHALVNRDFKIRLGAHTGNVIWGTIGITGMEKEAAIGDTVNFASRIEQANKALNTKFLISEALYRQFDKWCTISGTYEIEAKGKEGTHRVYALDRMLASMPTA